MASSMASSSSRQLPDSDNAASHRIHSALAPRIAVLSSPDVDEVLAPNNIHNLSDFLKPFQSSIEGVTVRTSQLETRHCKSFPLSFEDLEKFLPTQATSNETLFTPADIVGSPQSQQGTPHKTSNHKPAYTRPEVILDAVSARISSKSKALWENPDIRTPQKTHTRQHTRNKSSVCDVDAGLSSSSEESAWEDLDRYRNTKIEYLTPWFTDMRDLVLGTRHVEEHETFGHPVAIVLAVSSSSSDPMNAFASLYEKSQAHACPAFSQRPYVDPLVFRYYLLIHDVSKQGTDISESIALLENVKKTYGLHCCLLTVNSAHTSIADGSIPVRSDSVSDIWYRALEGGEKGVIQTDEKTSSSTVGHDFMKRNENDGVPSSDNLLSEHREIMNAWNAQDSDANRSIDYAALIDDNDVRRIKTFVRDFAAQSLIPFLERCVHLWNEQLAASRKGLTGRLLGAGRKFFASSSRSSQGQPSTSFAALGYYPHTTLEQQTRRLADFAFMTRDYKLAAAMYDILRRDYSNDKAVKFLAGANELFGLSHLMSMLCSQTTPIDVDSYLATAEYNYLLAPRPKGSVLQLDSLRATLLYYEAYRALNYYRTAPLALVRTASEGSGDSDNDLEVVAAMLLEQAALADLRQSRHPALRKCALHFVMAAHRFRKCGQKHLSLRCFHAASFYYKQLQRRGSAGSGSVGVTKKEASSNSKDENDDLRIVDYVAAHQPSPIHSWNLIDDHMEHELAQQAFNDGRVSQAVVHYLRLLQNQSKDVGARVSDDALRHNTYMEGFLTCCRFLEQDLKDVLKERGLQPSICILEPHSAFIDVHSQTQHDDTIWRSLEKEALGDVPPPQAKFQNSVTVNETFSLCVTLKNPFNIPLSIDTLTAHLVNADTSEPVEDESLSVETLSTLTLQPCEQRQVAIRLKSTSTRKLRADRISYALRSGIELSEKIANRGRRLNDTQEQRKSKSPVYAPSEAVSVLIREARPTLEASIVDARTRICLGEEIGSQIRVTNLGKAPMQNLRALIWPPDTLVSEEKGNIQGHLLESDNTLYRKNTVPIELPGNQLDAGKSNDWRVVLRGSAIGSVTVRVLFLYENIEGKLFSGQLQHSIQVDPALDVHVHAAPTRTGTFGYELHFEITNLLGEESQDALAIHRLSFIAPGWKASEGQEQTISDLAIDTHTKNVDIHIEDTSLEPEPMMNLGFTAEQLKRALTGIEVKNAAEVPPVPLTISSVGSGPSDISPFLLHARREYRMASLKGEFPSLTNGADADILGTSNPLKEIFMLFEPRDIDIVAHWQTKHRSGQSFIFGLQLGPQHDYLEDVFVPRDKATRSMYQETELQKAAIWNDIQKSRLHVEEDSIMVEFAIPDTITSHFQDGRASFDIPLLVRNLSTVRKRHVVLQLENTLPSSSASGTVSNPNAPVMATYIGRLTLRTTLEPKMQTVLTARASALKPGHIHLGPVLIRNMAEKDDGKQGVVSSSTRTFQRWEHCWKTVFIQNA